MRKETGQYLCGVKVVLLIAVLAGGHGWAQMKEPTMVTLQGTVIDLTCAAKGRAMADSWMNTAQDHRMPDGNVQQSCATMCLMGGQPAALFSNGRIAAVFACNPRATLANFAARTVEVQGHWAGEGRDVKPFVPLKIRAGSGAWQDVNCATMHE